MSTIGKQDRYFRTGEVTIKTTGIYFNEKKLFLLTFDSFFFYKKIFYVFANKLHALKKKAKRTGLCNFNFREKSFDYFLFCGINY